VTTVVFLRFRSIRLKGQNKFPLIYCPDIWIEIGTQDENKFILRTFFY